MSPSPAPDRDRGFTLVEMLVTMMMIGLIAAVLGAAITVIFRSEDSAIRVTAESHDTQQAVNYFPLDVQAGPTPFGAYNTAPAAAGCVPDGTNVLDFVKGTRRVSYRLIPVGPSTRLDRFTCDNSGTVAAPVWTNVERVNVADRLDSSATPPAFVTPVAAADGTLESAELTLVQRGADASIIASPRAEPRTSPGDCNTTNPIEASHGYGTFTEGDVTLKSGTVTGWVGAGGTLSWESNISVATDNMSGVDPAFAVYANDVNWTGDGVLPAKILDVGRPQDTALGTAFVELGPGGDVVKETSTSTENYFNLSGSSNPDAVAISSLPASDVIDFGADFDELRDCSAQLARAIDVCATSGCAEEIGITLSVTNVNLCAGGPRAQILNIPETYMAAGYTFTSTGPGCTGISQARPIIINVIDTGDLTVDIDTSAFDWENVAGDTKNIIFNFPNSENVNINAAFFGQVLAPFAHVQTFSDVEGGVIAQQWTHHAGTIYSAADLFDNSINWP